LIAIGVLVCMTAALAAVHAPARRRAATLIYRETGPVLVPDASDNGDGVTTGFVDCPDSHANPIGGGAQISGHQSSLDLEIKSSGPGLGQSWVIDANNSSGSRGSMVEHAICAKGRFVVATKHGDPIPPNDEGGALVSCPRGTKLAGGGVVTHGGDHATEIGDTEPADGNDGNSKRDDAWVAGVNNGSASTVHLTVTAVCAKRGTYKVVSSRTERLADSSQVTAFALCPRGAQVTSGGVRITGTDSDLEVAQSAPIDSGDRGSVPDNGWRGAANNQSTGQPQRMQTFAVCKT
jgi:hypothetical protein